MKLYMLRIGVSSNLDADDLESVISGALDAADIDNTIYQVVETDQGQQWTLAADNLLGRK